MRGLPGRLVLLGLGFAALALTACEPAVDQVPTEAVPAVATPAAPPPPATAAPLPTPRDRTSASTVTPVAVSTPVPRGDFGDAPDGSPAGYANARIVGRFPTQLKTLNGDGPGAHILRPGADRLGSLVTREAGANDPDDEDGTPNLVNADGGDDGVRGLTVQLSGVPPQARLTVQVSLSPEAALGPRFVNVLIDMNLDGRWSDEPSDVPEWAVRNWRLQAAGGASVTVRSDPFPMAAGKVLPDKAWMRVLLTRTPIQADSWDGSGSWTFGEIEDYQIAVPVPPGTEPGLAPAIAVVECPTELRWPPAVLLARLGCEITNVGVDGSVELRAIRAAGRAHMIPEVVAVERLRAGASRAVAFAVLRADGATRFRVRDLTPESRTRVEGGQVVLGISRADRTFATIPGDDDDALYHDDPAADYFSIVTGAAVEGFGFADIRRVAVGGARLDADVVDVLRRALPMVGSDTAPRALDAFVVVIVELADAIPLDEPALGFQFGIVIEGNDDPTDNWQPLVGAFDLYQTTDQWYEVIYSPVLEPRWRLQRRDATAPLRSVTTGAMAFLDGARLLLLIPSSEFEREASALRVRVTSFVHEPDDPTGATKASMADAFPELGMPLAAFGGERSPRG